MHIIESRRAAFAPFTTVPDRASSPRPIHTRFVGSHAPISPLVLVVDDHEDSRVIVRIVLESAGFQVG